MFLKVYDRTPEPDYYSSFNKNYFYSQFEVYEPTVSLNKNFFRQKKVKTISVLFDMNGIYITDDTLHFIELDTNGNVLKVDYRNKYGYRVLFANCNTGKDSLKTISYSKDGILVRVDSVFSHILKNKKGNDVRFFCAKVYQRGSLINKEYDYYNNEYYDKVFYVGEIGFLNLPLKRWERKAKAGGYILLTKKLPVNYNDSEFYHCESNLQNVSYNEHSYEQCNFLRFLKRADLSKESLVLAKHIIGQPVHLPYFKEPFFLSSLKNDMGGCMQVVIRDGAFNPMPGRKYEVYTNHPEGMNDTLYMEHHPIDTSKVIAKPTHSECKHYLESLSCIPVRRIKYTFQYTYFKE